MPEPGGPTGEDLAVILARGRSERMGRPKGWLDLGDGRPGFVVRIARLYVGWAETVVVVRREEEAGYRRYLGEVPQARVLGAADSGGTALTVALGWAARRGDPRRVWVHPVDLPLVLPGTVDWLRTLAADAAGRILRPRHEGVPGHPVVLPAGFVAWLAADEAAGAGSVGSLLNRDGAGARWPVEDLPCADRGVVQDFDRPEDLPGGARWEEP